MINVFGRFFAVFVVPGRLFIVLYHPVGAVLIPLFALLVEIVIVPGLGDAACLVVKIEIPGIAVGVDARISFHKLAEAVIRGRINARDLAV